MSRLVIVVVLAGCYSPGHTTCAISCANATDCPDDLVCSTSGRCAESRDDCTSPPGVDAPITDDATDGIKNDGQPTQTCVLPGTNPAAQEFTNVAGAFYTSNGSLAIYQVTDGTFNETDPNANTTGTPAVVANGVAGRVFSRPHIDPGASNDLFLRVDDQQGVHLATASYKMGVIWNAPINLMTPGLTPGISLTPSSPTTTNPRRMVVGNGNAAFFEGIENNGSWEFHNLDTTGFVVTFLLAEDPALSSDGFSMVFRGQLPSGTIGVYLTTRASFDDKFGMPTLLANDVLGTCVEHTPSFAPDCSHVYYSCESPDRVIMLF